MRMRARAIICARSLPHWDGGQFKGIHVIGMVCVAHATQGYSNYRMSIECPPGRETAQQRAWTGSVDPTPASPRGPGWRC